MVVTFLAAAELVGPAVDEPMGATLFYWVPDGAIGGQLFWTPGGLAGDPPGSAAPAFGAS